MNEELPPDSFNKDNDNAESDRHIPIEEAESQVSKNRQRIIGAGFATIILGIIGSGLWDMVVKPGVTGFGRFTLSLFTLGSVTLRNAAYSSAALDPTPLPALMIF